MNGRINEWMDEFMAKWMNKLINIGQSKVIGNCVNFEMNILIRKVWTLEVFIKITYLNVILESN
jgi:hypothetical protein